MNFSERLRTLRLKAGYTQIELAKMINLNSQGAYGKYERGVGTPLPDDEPLCLPKRLKQLRLQLLFNRKQL
ncbi:helix-turn-helix domain-containing protein, partial [Lactococcus lactis]